MNKNISELYPDFLVKIINNRINYFVERYNQAPQILKKAIDYSMKNGGKRFRPVLCLLVAESLGKDFEIVIPTACAIEFIHTYSLIHDDLPSIDNDDYRRGRLTCHKIFGESIAILTGDALFAEAFNIILKYQECSPEIKLSILKEIGEASGVSGMVAGQTVDVYYTGKKISEKLLECMHENKTGKLITAAIKCGAILSEACDDYIKKFIHYGNNIGLVFQITDDILDLESTKEITGKTTGKDTLQKKNTFPSIYGIPKSKKIAAEKIKEAIDIVKSMDIKSEWLIKIAEFLLIRKN
jgi:geranylgeranyl diphosphate synthase type II